jgi:hypothetical protein
MKYCKLNLKMDKFLKKRKLTDVNDVNANYNNLNIEINMLNYFNIG